MAALSPATRAVLFPPKWTPRKLGSALTLWVAADLSPMAFVNTAYAGTGVVSQSGSTLTGVGTAFLSEVKVGDLITATAISEHVVSIEANDSLTLDGSVSSGAGLTYTITPVAGVNDRISQINDLSGLGNHMTRAVSASRPALQPNQIGGRRAIVLDGVDDFLSVTATLFSVSTGAVFTAVYPETITDNQATPDLNACVWSVTGGNAGVYLKTGATAISLNYVGAVAKVAASTIVAAVPSIVEWAHDSGFVRSSVNGEAITSAAADDTDSFTTFRIGALGSTTNNRHRVGECVVVNRALTPVERVRMIRYLGRRWGAAVAA